MPPQAWQLDIGANVTAPDQARFSVWAPHARRVDVHVLGHGRKPVPLTCHSRGHFEVTIPGAAAGDRYVYILDGDKKRPDPASRSQPDGVHGPSEIVDPHQFHWTDQQWRGVPLGQFIIY